MVSEEVSQISHFYVSIYSDLCVNVYDYFVGVFSFSFCIFLLCSYLFDLSTFFPLSNYLFRFKSSSFDLNEKINFFYVFNFNAPFVVFTVFFNLQLYILLCCGIENLITNLVISFYYFTVPLILFFVNPFSLTIFY